MTYMGDLSNSLPLLASEVNARKFIQELLASQALPTYSMDVDQLDGYMRAVATELRSTTPNEWIPLVFGGEYPSYIAGYSQEAITNALICLYNSHRVQIQNHECNLSFPYRFTENREGRVRAEQWARGFMQGYIFWQEVWGQFLDENQTGLNQAVILPASANDEIDDILATITAVADANYAMSTGVTLEQLTVMFERLPKKVIEYGRIAHIIRSNSDADTCERAEPAP